MRMNGAWDVEEGLGSIWASDSRVALEGIAEGMEGSTVEEVEGMTMANYEAEEPISTVKERLRRTHYAERTSGNL